MPLRLPRGDEVPAAGGSAQLVVAVSRDDVALFSASGLEGSVGEPKLRREGHGPDALAALRAALVEISGRRPDERRIVAMFDAGTPVQTVLEVLATVRARDDGSALLPDVVLSGGYR